MEDIMDVFVAFLIIALLFVARFALPALVMALYGSLLNRLYARWG
jgi:hypothetical protein